jgi:hypothetical protein
MLLRVEERIRTAEDVDQRMFDALDNRTPEEPAHACQLEIAG